MDIITLLKVQEFFSNSRPDLSNDLLTVLICIEGVRLEKMKKFQFKAIITVTMIMINLIQLKENMLDIF